MFEKIKEFLKLVGLWLLLAVFVGGMLGGSMRPQGAFVWGAFTATVMFIVADLHGKGKF